MLPNKLLQKDYTLSSLYYQIKLPLDVELLIPADDPVRLLSAFVEGMELSDLYQTYGKIKKNRATPRQLFKIMVYASMNRIYSSRDIETACHRDINFMYLLEGKPVPDHATFARFLSLHFAQCSKKTLAELSQLLYSLGEISGKTIFIDGTKIESAANKYTFIWKKAVTKHQARLFDKILLLVKECEELYGWRIVHHRKVSLHTLKRLRKKLYRLKREEGIVFVHGRGHRKTHLQRSLETLESYIEKLKEYDQKLHICGERNSYSKTDTDATFMRMKEDAMMNGQLKPAYNLQHGVDSEYVTWLDISPRPTDTRTLIPFLKDMGAYLPFKYQEIVADAGYESEENYLFLEGNDQLAYIKPQNYEISKTRKYRQDIGRMENMEYDEGADCYHCKNGQVLTKQYEKHEKTASGYRRTVTVYRCSNCHGCPFKTKCIKGNHCKTPMEDRQKVLYVSKKMKEKRQETLKRITSEYGTQLRMNRSIQAEGSFADIKEDMGFRRYLYRGKENVTAQSILLAIGYNMKKLHHKIQSGRIGQHLFPLKKSR
ncbi:IS1182 family transposase [Anaerostipes butyraticus]|uniref:IS1182 family transposase n=1 Tax=Anaerostipes butyraticus TaxID=645466 RepID=UPI001915B269|nr:IS1182 family transposase [Anaerostipes butyraticus]